MDSPVTSILPILAGIPLLADVEWLGQQFEWHDIAVVGLLVILEGVLSIDNALVLGLLAKRLPPQQRARALTYGLVGAFVFRLIAVGTASYLLRWRWVKLLGGMYLVYVSLKYFIFESRAEQSEHIAPDVTGMPVLLDDQTGKPVEGERAEEEIQERTPFVLEDQVPRKAAARFWPTVFSIELTDLAFAVDSILAAIALVGAPPAGHSGPHPKLWVVITGGMLGVILMRIAAVIFIRLLEKFPRFESAAYWLVIAIGGKLLVDWGFNGPTDPHRVDFHDWRSPAFWCFWGIMLLSFLSGFLPKRRQKPES